MRDGVLEAGGAAMGRRGRDAVPMSDEKVSDEKVNVGIGMGEMRNSLYSFSSALCGVGMVLGRGRDDRNSPSRRSPGSSRNLA